MGLKKYIRFGASAPRVRRVVGITSRKQQYRCAVRSAPHNTSVTTKISGAPSNCKTGAVLGLKFDGLFLTFFSSDTPGSWWNPLRDLSIIFFLACRTNSLVACGTMCSLHSRRPCWLADWPGVAHLFVKGCDSSPPMCIISVLSDN